MSKRTTTPIRFSEGQNAAVKRIAETCGVKEAEIVRWAVEALQNYFDHHGGRLLLPLRFHETFSVTNIVPGPKNVTLTETTPNLESGSRRSLSRPRRAQTAK